MNNNESTELFSIGNIAKSFGVSENTIRRMEAAGLLTPALIKESGYRYYDYQNISRIKMILFLRSMGLVYDDMREYFKNPEDFTVVKNKLLYRKYALDVLIDQADHFIKPEVPGKVLIIQHDRICLYTKHYQTNGPLSVRDMERYASDVLAEAVKAKYPVDFARPISILTDCNDYRTFNPYLPLDLTFCIALREDIVNKDTYMMPPRTVLAFAWHEGMDFNVAMKNINQCMADNHFEQSAPLGATFEIGRHIDNKIKDTGYLFHIIIPCEKAGSASL